MSDTPGILVTGITGVVAVATAFITRGANAGVVEAKKQIDALGLRVTTLEAQVKETAAGAAKAVLDAAEGKRLAAEARAFVAAQLEAAKQEIRTELARARRAATGAGLSSHAMEDVAAAREKADGAARDVAELARRIEEVERDQREDRAALTPLQRDFDRLIGRLEGLLGERKQR